MWISLWRRATSAARSSASGRPRRREPALAPGFRPCRASSSSGRASAARRGTPGGRRAAVRGRRGSDGRRRSRAQGTGRTPRCRRSPRAARRTAEQRPRPASNGAPAGFQSTAVRFAGSRARPAMRRVRTSRRRRAASRRRLRRNCGRGPARRPRRSMSWKKRWSASSLSASGCTPRGIRDHAVGGHDGETFDAIRAGHVRMSRAALYGASRTANAKGRPSTSRPSPSNPMTLLLDGAHHARGRALADGRQLLLLLDQSSSYCGSDFTESLAFMCTIL